MISVYNAFFVFFKNFEKIHREMKSMFNPFCDFSKILKKFIEK